MNQTEIGLPPVVRHLPHGDGDSRMNLFRVEVGRQCRVAEVDGFRRLADK
jgi:hypothetical protein